jgi:sedoheptulokinase
MAKTYLGLDIGTTKCAAVIFDVANRRLLDSASTASKAGVPSPVEGGDEQNPERIFATLFKLVRELSPELRAKVGGVGVCGQMHGVLLRGESGSVSNLISWRDRRALADGSLAEFKDRPGCAELKSGFGFTTLAWLSAKGALESKWRSACAIHDHLVAELCALAKPVTDSVDAASWGLFDVFSDTWDLRAVEALNVERRLLPALVPPGSKAGGLSAKYAKLLGLREGTPVAVATGDNQAAVLACGEDFDEELYVNVGTGAQICVAPRKENVEGRALGAETELRPFFHGRLLAAASPLCGGESFAWLAGFAKGVFDGLGRTPPSESEIYRRLDELGMRSVNCGLLFEPCFAGRRGDPTRRASISKINLLNFGLGPLAASLAEGLMIDMKSMLPDWAFEGRKRIVASGNAMRKLEITKFQARSVFGLPLRLPAFHEEAACGAAMLAARLD